ncbi:MAG: hypothetical protein WDZ31_08110 [Phycisphaeraceae bacterium]
MADTLRIETHDNRTHFEPGEMLHGLAGWELDDPPKSVELRLSWYTEGKGDQDVQVVQRKAFDHAPAVDAQVFEFPLPTEPYSFSGKLITLCWALELIVNGRQSTRLDLVIAPGAEEIDLNAPVSSPPAVEV